MSDVERDRRNKHLDDERARKNERWLTDWAYFYPRRPWWERLLYRLFGRTPDGWWWQDTP